MKGQKLRKKVKEDQISNFIKSKHIVRQNEALDVNVGQPTTSSEARGQGNLCQP